MLHETLRTMVEKGVPIPPEMFKKTEREFMFGIAFNEFRGAARKRKELALDDVENLPEEPATSANPQLRLDLTEALKLLNSNERTAVLLCCQNGLSHEEAAQVLDCPLGTVKTNVLRGKEKLRRNLAPAYENYEPA